MSPIFTLSNEIEPMDFKQASEITNKITIQLIADIESKLKSRRRQLSSQNAEKLEDKYKKFEERYKKLEDKIKTIEENFKIEINNLKLEKINLNGKNFKQNAVVQSYSINSPSITKISAMNDIIEKFTDNKRRFLIQLITENQAFKKIKNKYSNSNVNKINIKALESTTKTNSDIPKNSAKLYKSIIKLHKLLNDLNTPNSTSALRKTVLNVSVKFVTDKLKLINEKQKFLLDTSNTTVNNQVKAFNSLKESSASNSTQVKKKGKPKTIGTSTNTLNAGTGPDEPPLNATEGNPEPAVLRRSTRTTAGVPHRNNAMLVGNKYNNATTSANQARPRTAPPGPIKPAIRNAHTNLTETLQSTLKNLGMVKDAITSKK